MRALRLAAIGTWGHGGAVLRQIEGLAGVEVAGLAPAGPEESTAALARDLPAAAAARHYADADSLLREGRPDVVVISTRLDRIPGLAMAAAAAGCHSICEKPLALDRATLRRLHAAVRATGTQCLPLMCNAAHPAMVAARGAIADGRIGDVVLINARKSYRFGTRPEWFGRREIYGGTIPWIGIHALDYIQAASGAAFLRVAAMQSNAVHRSRPGCEDNAGLVLELSGGRHATASLDFLRPEAAPTHGDDWVRIVGSRGIIEAFVEQGRCTLIAEKEPPQDLPVAPAATPVFGDWLQALAREPSSLSPETVRGFTLTDVALCARDAADEGRVVTIEPGPWSA